MASTKSGPIVFLCNGCFVEMTLFGETPPSTDGQPVKNSFISECLHVLCRQCRNKCNQQCAVCKKTTRFMTISRKMPERYQTFFNTLTKTQTKLERVISFQTWQAQLSGKKFVDKREKLKQKSVHAEEAVNGSKQKYQTTRDDKHQMKIICKIIHDSKRLVDFQFLMLNLELRLLFHFNKLFVTNILSNNVLSKSNHLIDF